MSHLHAHTRGMDIQLCPCVVLTSFPNTFSVSRLIRVVLRVAPFFLFHT